MKTSFTREDRRGGFALIAMMASLVVILIVFAGIMFWLTTNGNQVQHNETYINSEAAAEGATEMIFSQMDRDFLYQSLNPSSVYQALTPSLTGWPVSYTFNVSVTEGTQSTVLQYLSNQYTNLMGQPQTNIITVTATPSGQLYNVPATVSQTIVFASVPAFQFAIFYNIDLDMSPGSAMTIQGATFCNENIWCYPGGQMTFNGSVEAAGSYYFAWDTNGDQSGNISGSPLTPVFNQGTPLSHANPLILPIGASSPTNNSSTNVEAIINIPPAGATAPQAIAYASTNQVYDFNAASLIISNALNGTNSSRQLGNPFTVYFQDCYQNPSFTESNSTGWHWVRLTNDVFWYTNHFGSTNTPFCTNWVQNFVFTNQAGVIQWTNSPPGTNTVFYAGFSFVTNVTFTDYRESDTVQAMQIDVSKLRNWIVTNYCNGGSNWSQYLSVDTGHGINSIYAYNDTPYSTTQLPGVCLVNGSLLPNSTNVVNFTNCVTSGLTVATPQPLYVVGHYNVQRDGGSAVTGSHNTAATYPAGFLADAITVLSSSWWGDWTNTGWSSRNAVSTTINAACLEGIVPSTGNGSGSGAHYSGGIENFLRLLEDWNGPSATLTYNGSIMVMFPSQYATNYWQLPQNYYDKPTRNWGFDTNFLIQSKLPPLTPQFRTVIRYNWTGY